MNNEEFNDYTFYIIDLVSLIIAMIFSIAEAYTGGRPMLMYNGPLVIGSFFFKYIYLCYYVISKLAF
jgi:hypothetical protein